MRVEIDFEGGKNSAGIFVHRKLPEAMGHSVAAFAAAMLGGGTSPGVWYPEEKEALAVSRAAGLVRSCAMLCAVSRATSRAQRPGPRADEPQWAAPTPFPPQKSPRAPAARWGAPPPPPGLEPLALTADPRPSKRAAAPPGPARLPAVRLQRHLPV
jgi:hypothetical protein